ncbi:MAG: hypothetical protein ACO29X_00275 [Arcobacteraceae bacterium]|jgi:hypothetical protein
MNIYIYARSGHNFGMENIRRCSAIYKELAHLDPLLATADYRAASFAKSELGVKKGLGVDIIGNLPHMMRRKDILIFDSFEPSETMREYMKDFCEILLEVGVDIPYDILDDTYFSPSEKINEKGFFFADDDYEAEMLDLTKDCKNSQIPILLGHYFFLGTDEKLAPYFSEIYEDEDYEKFIKGTKYLLTSCVHTALESLASGNHPVFFARHTKPYKGELHLLEKYNIPQISGSNLDKLVMDFDKIISNYPKTNKIEKVDISGTVKNIEDTMKKFEEIFQ